MNLYTRWIDTKGRLWICVGRFGKIIEEKAHPHPSTLVLLNVEEEKAHTFDYDVIMEQIKKGNFKQKTA